MKRWDFLIRLLRERPHRAGAEIGVGDGRTSAALLRALPGLERLYCVDPWEYYQEYESDKNPETKPGWPSQPLLDEAYEGFLRRVSPFRERVTILMMRSLQAATCVADGALDFVFMDANHVYSFVREDIALWAPKVRAGGIVSGHDYNRWPRVWGVKRAVDEAFGSRVRTAEDWCWWVELENRRVADGEDGEGCQ